MPRLVAAIIVLAASLSTAASRVTVARLETLLARRQSDAATAASLAGVELQERISRADLARLLGQARGPRTREALELMAMAAAFLSPPPSSLPAPPPERQTEILGRARTYAAQYVRGLPDFICARATRHFDDYTDAAGKRPEVWAGLRLRNTFVGELSYHRGGESYKGPSNQDAGIGMASTGEFGGIMIALLAGPAAPEIGWSHWEERHGASAAVFRYSVPAAQSNYTVGYCCAGGERTVGAIAAYRGEIHLDPRSGAVLRVTREAVGLPRTFLTVRAETVVDYDPVPVGPPGYLFPSRSVTVSESMVQTPRGRVKVRYLNDVRFLDYHKFAASSRLAGDEPDPPLQ